METIVLLKNSLRVNALSFPLLLAFPGLGYFGFLSIRTCYAPVGHLFIIWTNGLFAVFVAAAFKL